MAAIRLHHDLSVLSSRQTDTEVQTLVALGWLADGFVLEREGLKPEHDWPSQASAARNFLGVGEDEVGDWEHALQPVLDAV